MKVLGGILQPLRWWVAIFSFTSATYVRSKGSGREGNRGRGKRAGLNAALFKGREHRKYHKRPDSRDGIIMPTPGDRKLVHVRPRKTSTKGIMVELSVGQASGMIAIGVFIRTCNVAI